MKTKLSMKETIIVASMLFGIFFGAGNLIFPVHMGQLAGSNVWPAVIGFIITGVSIPILGVAAIGNTGSSGLYDLSSKVGPKYAYVFTCLLYLTIGPFFAIPRCATVSFTTGVAPMLGEASDTVPLLIFTAVFFAFVLFFSLRPGGIMTWIGKIINPLFLLFLGVLIVASFMNPYASISEVAPDPSYESGAFFNGFLEGYNTMDAIASLAIALIVINVIKNLGVKESSCLAKETVKAGIFAGILMAIIYICTTIMGTQSRGMFETSANGGIALAEISNSYLGRIGAAVLAITITLACLKTAIGLVTSFAGEFAKMFPKISYYKWVYGTTIFAFAVSNVGLSAIITYAIPFLMLLYPPAIAIIILALTERLFGKARSVYVCTTTGACFAAIFDFIKTLPFGIDVSFAAKFLPFFDLGLGWIVPTIIGFIVGLALKNKIK